MLESKNFLEQSRSGLFLYMGVLNLRCLRLAQGPDVGHPYLVERRIDRWGIRCVRVRSVRKVYLLPGSSVRVFKTLCPLSFRTPGLKENNPFESSESRIHGFMRACMTLRRVKLKGRVLLCLCTTVPHHTS